MSLILPDVNKGTGLSLILNAAAEPLQVILAQSDQPICMTEWFGSKHTAEVLAAAITNIFEIAKISIEDICRIACINGPGSFTGIRLVLATSAALLRAQKAGSLQLAPLDYLQAVATTASVSYRLPYATKIMTLIPAHNRQIYVQFYNSFGWQMPAYNCSILQKIPQDNLLNLVKAVLDGEKSNFLEQCLEKTEALWLAGLALKQYPELAESFYTLQKDYPNLHISQNYIPSKEALCILSRHGDYEAKDLEPVYASPCTAQVNLQNVNNSENIEAVLNTLLQKKPESQI